MQDETIEIAGQPVSMRSWGIAKQLAAAFSSYRDTEDKPLKLEHQLALAYNAGYTSAKAEGIRTIDLNQTINTLDQIADDLRKLHRQS